MLRKITLAVISSGALLLGGCIGEVGDGNKSSEKASKDDEDTQYKGYKIMGDKKEDIRMYGDSLTSPYKEGIDDYSVIYRYMVQKYSEGIIDSKVSILSKYYKKIDASSSKEEAQNNIRLGLAINEMLKEQIEVTEDIREGYSKEIGSYKVVYTKLDANKVRELDWYLGSKKGMLDKYISGDETVKGIDERIVNSESSGADRDIYLELQKEKDIDVGDEFEIIYGNTYYVGKLLREDTMEQRLGDMKIRALEFKRIYENTSNASELYGYYKNLEKKYPKEYKIKDEYYDGLSKIIKAKHQGEEYSDVGIDIVAEVSTTISNIIRLEGELREDEEKNNLVSK